MLATVDPTCLRTYRVDISRIAARVARFVIPDIAHIIASYAGPRHAETMRHFPDYYWGMVREPASRGGVDAFASAIALFVDQPLGQPARLSRDDSDTLSALKSSIAQTRIDTRGQRTRVMCLLWETILLLWPGEPETPRIDHAGWLRRARPTEGRDDAAESFHRERVALAKAIEPHATWPLPGGSNSIYTT